jgi:hypothetical protein
MDHTASLASVDHDDLRVSTHLSLRGAMERGQMPSELDVEMLRGENYGKGGKKVWPPKFAAWAARFSKKRAGDAPASVETDGGGASATEAAHAAVAELLRAAANHPSRHAVVSELPRGRIRAFARRASFPPIPLEHRRVAPSPLSRLVVSCRHLRRACARRGDASERDRMTTPPPRVDAAARPVATRREGGVVAGETARSRPARDARSPPCAASRGLGSRRRARAPPRAHPAARASRRRVRVPPRARPATRFE